MDIDHHTQLLGQMLTPKRLQHSLGVMQVIGELAEVYGLNCKQAQLAGLLHDAAKDLTPEQQEEALRDANLALRHPEELDYVLYLHGPISAHIVEKMFGVADRLVLNAIRTHTAMDGEDFDHPLSWCLRFSDLLEPNRDWRGVRWLHKGLPRLRAAVYAGRMDEAALLQYGLVEQWFTAEGLPVHPNIRRVVAERFRRLKLDASFLE